MCVCVCGHVKHGCVQVNVDWTFYIVQYCSGSPVGGDDVDSKKYVDRHRINKSIFDSKHIGRPMLYVLTRTPRSTFTTFTNFTPPPRQVVGPPGQQLDKLVGPLAKMSAGSTLIADTDCDIIEIILSCFITNHG